MNVELHFSPGYQTVFSHIYSVILFTTVEYGLMISRLWSSGDSGSLVEVEEGQSKSGGTAISQKNVLRSTPDSAEGEEGLSPVHKGRVQQRPPWNGRGMRWVGGLWRSGGKAEGIDASTSPHDDDSIRARVCVCVCVCEVSVWTCVPLCL